MSVLCKLGFHKPDKTMHLKVYKQVGRHKWHRNYVVCSRCGKRIAFLSVNRKKEDNP